MVGETAKDKGNGKEVIRIRIIKDYEILMPMVSIALLEAEGW
jgi:hypothetical protein